MKYSRKKPPGEGFTLAFGYTMCVSIGLFVYLMTQISAPEPEKETPEEEVTPVDDGYVPPFNTSGDTDWDVGLCLVITMGIGVFILAGPKLLVFTLKCIIRIRHGRDALVHVEKTAENSKTLEVDEESNLVSSRSTVRQQQNIVCPEIQTENKNTIVDSEN
jgi:hypothetical protein